MRLLSEARLHLFHILPCINHRTTFSQATPSQTFNMPVTDTDDTIIASTEKYEDAKRWLQRRMRKAASRQTLKGTKANTNIQQKVVLKQPFIAPAGENVFKLEVVAVTPTAPVDVKRATSRPPMLPPIRPARPDSSVVRDVDTWLEASMNTPSQPLMSGLSYWKEVTIPGVKNSAIGQYAIPLSVALGVARPANTTRQRTYFRRSSRRVQVQMCSLLRTKSKHPPGKKCTNGRSTSIPPLTIPHENVQEGATSVLIKQSTSFIKLFIPPLRRQISAYDEALLPIGRKSRECTPSRLNTPNSNRFGDVESDSERHVNKMFMHTPQDADSSRQSAATASLVREDSMGDLSDAPTYSSGPPPPSYRSRRESTLTTSSFGCIDGMNPVQRQISQQRATSQRGMRCRLKRLAKKISI
jgi:hypothetical protein